MSFNLNLSFAQERLWFIEQYEGGSYAYNAPFVLCLSSTTESKRLINAIQKVIFRHEILRSFIKTDMAGNGYQCVMNDPLNILEMKLTPEERKAYIQQEVYHVFQLDKEYPIRVTLFNEINSDKRYLCVVIHHIAFDGWSMGVFLQDLQAYYQAEVLPELSIQYKDFAAWQRDYFTEETLSDQIFYWKTIFHDYKPLQLSTDKPRPNRIDYRGEDIPFVLKESTSLQLRELAKTLKVSLYSVLLSGYYLLLRSFCQQDDIIVGTPMANRQHEQLQPLIGFFVNTLPLRSQIVSKMTLIEYIESVAQNVMEAQLHQDLPFEKLITELSIEPDTSRHPLFQVLFSVQPFTLQNQLLFDADIESVPYSAAKFDLTTMLDDSKPQLTGLFNYAVSLFTSSSIEHLIGTYQFILEQIANLSFNQTLKIQDLCYLNPEDYHRVMDNWNATEADYLFDKMLHQLFEEQVARTPNNIAVVVGHDLLSSLTYKTLNDKANQLAKYLLNKSGQLIGILSEKGANQVIATLAIMKSGHGYLPLNMDWPVARLDEILEEGQVALLLISREQYKQHGQVLEKKYQLLVIEDFFENEGVIEVDTTCNEADESSSAWRIAYVIFTSGSSGKPKGVTISHRGAVNTILAVNQRFNVNETDKILALSELSFDLSVYDIFGLLAVGGTIVFPEQNKTKDPAHWLSLIHEHKITLWNTVPQLVDLLIHANAENLSVRSMRLFLLSGDWIPIALSQQIKKISPSSQIISLGGATEGSIWSIWYEINNILPDWTAIPYGKAMPNQKMYILNTDQTHCPLGSAGEIYIGGAGVALNYWQDLKKTAASFIEHPQLGRLYKTGDRGRWNKAGYIEFLGRNDFQVKIHGFRIELGEIEHALLKSHPAIQQAVTMVNQQTLLGYYVSIEKLNEDILLTSLAAHLPEYMIPIALIWLEKLPLTMNGKLDRDALCALYTENFKLTISENPTAPTNKQEAEVCTIFAKVLEISVNQLSMEDDFFRLGGNSILAIKLINQMNHSFKSALKIQDIFTQRTIKKLSQLISETTGCFLYKKYILSDSNEKELFEPFALNNVQQAYYLGRSDYFELGNVTTHSYAEFKFAHLNVEKLEKAFNKLLERHLSLRTVFTQEQQCYLEKIPYYKIVFQLFEQESAFLDFRNKLSNKVYNPEVFPLFDIVVSQINNTSILHISFDALLMDANSVGILFKELTQLYKDIHTELPKLNIHYRDYLIQHKKIRESHLWAESKQYWLNQLDSYCFDMQLPLKKNSNPIKKPEFSRISKSIPQNIWNALKKQAELKGISPTAILLVIYGRVLCHWSNQKAVCINLTLFNRLPLHPQANNILGDFTTLELFNYQNISHASLLETFKNNHEILWKDIEHNLFDGIDFQRLIRQEKNFSQDRIIAPVVLTSVLGDNPVSENFIDPSYEGMSYSITQTPQIWLDNKAYEIAGKLMAEWDYVDQLFDPEIIAAMHEDYCGLIEKIALADWNEAVLPILKITQNDALTIEKANQDFLPFIEETLVSYYEKYLLQNPELQNSVCVIDSGKKSHYTHKELLADMNILSKYFYGFIEKNKIQNTLLIGVLSEKGYNHVVAPLAIMKSGYAYLPLSMDWPIGRLCEVLEEGQVKLLLISRAQYAKMDLKTMLEMPCHFIVIEDVMEHGDNLFFSSGSKFGKREIQPDDLAYVIFTSGSSGKPKGVAISHRGALNTILAVNQRFQVNSSDKILALSEFSFDLSVYDIFGLLAAGGTIVFPEQNQLKEPNHWLSLIHEHKITLWNTVPQLAALLMNKNTNVQSIRLYLLSGDWIPTHLPEQIKKISPSSQIISLGGATEGSIWSIWYEIDTIFSHWTAIPYGIAMPNQKMYVLNDNKEHCPIGVVGEIYIGGVGVALNYWRDGEKTNASFIEHPLMGRLYKTGDLGCWNKNGYMEIQGRKDNQIKLNGYRVELEEISAKLMHFSGIQEAVVKTQSEENQDYLVAYLLPEQWKPLIQDKEMFTLEQHGLMKIAESEKNVTYCLDVVLNEKKYITRKSYRNFTEETLSQNVIEKIVTEASDSLYKNENQASQDFNFDALNRLLSSLSGLKLSDKILPKYRYPSAGSSYCVRTYVALNENVNMIKRGYYYFHPVNHTLILQDEAVLSDEMQIDFVIYWPAIQALYPDNAEKFAYLEIGHMLALLGTEYAWSIKNKKIDENNTLAVSVVLKKALKTIKKIQCYYKGKNDLLDWHAQQNVFDKASELNHLCGKANGLLTIEAESTHENLVLSGMLFQKISEKLDALNIGSCILGVNPDKQSLYSMVFGGVTVSEQKKSESHAYIPPLNEVINDELKKYLPEYMLPYDYRMIEQIPLTSNGKRDLSQLPRLEIIAHRFYVAPRTEMETRVCEIFAELLSLDSIKISMMDSFFRLGGNSLLAMQLVNVIHTKLGIKLKLLDLYQFSTVEKMTRFLFSQPSKNLFENLSEIETI